MILTSFFLLLIMVMIWKINIPFVIAYALTIGLVELLYLSAVLYKFKGGGYLPLAFATVLLLIMATWNSVYRKKYNYEVGHKISSDEVKEIIAQTNICRLPGLAMFYSQLVQGIPPIFQHYVENVPALRLVLVFVSIKSLPMSKVPVEEHFLFRRVEPRELNLFRCVARYGYTHARNQQEPFEAVLVEKLKEFIRNDYSSSPISINDRELMDDENMDGDRNMKQYYGDPETEIDIIDKAYHAGIVHLIGTEEVTARKGAGWWNRLVIIIS